MRLNQALALLGLMISFPASAEVIPVRELLITNLKVVEDPIRTRGCGVWTFCHLMNSLAKNQDAEIFTKAWLDELAAPHQINGFDVPGRAGVNNSILKIWPKTSTGKLDLAKAPFRLLAIVNRIDLRNAEDGNAGEGRFVFGLTDGATGEKSMTVIFEFKLPFAIATTKEWADLWHSVSAFPSFDSAYRQALEKVTEKFAANPRAVLGQLRTNDLELGPGWDLREFVVQGNPAKLTATTVKRTPQNTFNNSQALSTFINENEKDILNDSQSIRPPLAEGGNAPEDLIWNAKGIRNPEARHHFALNTCNGCHTSETGTGFLHITPRAAGKEALHSDFFTNTEIVDPVSGKVHVFNDLERRKLNFEALLAQQAGNVFIPGTGVKVSDRLQKTRTPPARIH